jgi:hypothetical protein
MNPQYRQVNGISYNVLTPQKVIDVLEQARQSRPRRRLSILYGDVNSGKNWGSPERGYIGNSTGSIKIPILVHNTRSLGGGSIMDSCILEIRESKGGKILYSLQFEQNRIAY